MQVHLNTDANVQGTEALAAWVRSELSDKLQRFRDHVTRIEVHLSDASAARVGATDKRCTLEARLARLQPVAVRHDAAKVGDAFHGAVEKLQRKLDAVFGRARDSQGRETIRSDKAADDGG